MAIHVHVYDVCMSYKNMKKTKVQVALSLAL